MSNRILYIKNIKTRSKRIKKDQFVRTMVINWDLCVVYHKNEVFLQIKWQILPIWLIQTFSHSLKILRRNFPEVTVEKKVRYARWWNDQHHANITIRISYLLQI